MTFEDDFDGAAGDLPDSSRWAVEIGGTGWGNQQRQYYTDDPANLSLDGEGNLAIRALPTSADTTLACWYGPCEFTSARINTFASFRQRYGTFEARMKMPTGGATWPAFWMMGIDRPTAGWPSSGEIDIVEQVGASPDDVRAVVHGPGYSGGQALGATLDVPDGTGEFHVYGVTWEPERIAWTIDGEEVEVLTPGDLPDGTSWVFDKPFYVLLNVAVGGSLAGSPGEADQQEQTLLVDWVRVRAGDQS